MKIDPRLRSALASVALVLALLFATPSEAHALYLDPATGSLILQVLAAGVLTAWFTIKGSFSRVKSFFGRLFGRSGDEAGPG